MIKVLFLQAEKAQIAQLTRERDEAREVAHRADEHSKSMAAAAGVALPIVDRPAGGLGDLSREGGLSLMIADGRRGAGESDGVVVRAGEGVPDFTPPAGLSRDGLPSYTTLMHELEEAKRRVREQAYEMRKMVRFAF
jgi:hypothetical protein